MSIKAMTWAFALPLEPRAKIALLAIADNARDDGVAWPSRDTIAEKSSQSRATVKRKMKVLADLGVLALAERFREDGTRTTDEIRLNLTLSAEEVMRRMQGLSDADRGEDDDDDDDSGSDVEVDAGPESGEGGGVQAEPLPVHSCTPTGAVVTRGPVHSCTPLNEPSLEPRIPPNPPLGGVHAEDGPLKKPDKAASQARDRLWQQMLGVYPGISAMDQQAGRGEFEHLSLDDAEWAVTAATPYGAECTKLRKPPKNVHIWLRKAMFKNFPRGGPPPARPDSFAVDSPEGRAIVALHQLARKSISTAGGRVVYRAEITPQLLAFAQAGERSAWPWLDSSEATRKQIGAWSGFVEAHVPGPRFPLLETRGIGTNQRTGIYAPWPWPPNKDGTVYAASPEPDPPASPEEPDHA